MMIVKGQQKMARDQGSGTVGYRGLSAVENNGLCMASILGAVVVYVKVFLKNKENIEI